MFLGLCFVWRREISYIEEKLKNKK